MKILMIVRSTLYSSAGGDTVQVDLTAKYLRELGVHVDVKFANEKIDYAGYDGLHFFNIIRPDDILPHINNKIPVFVSTIFVDYIEYERLFRKGLLKYIFKVLTLGQVEYIKALARWLKNGEPIKSLFYLLNGHKASIRFITKRAQLLLPNSHSEYRRLEKYVKLSAPYSKIVNAVDLSVFNDNVVANERFMDCILCVGRIEGRKNQLNLIKAIMGTPLQLVIIGEPSPNHWGYYQACKKLAATCDNVQIIDHISHQELVGIYKAAKVHVLPSWFETTGLSTLEAGVMGCNIVVTKKGDTEEYFGDFAFYCEPHDVATIKSAVFEAFRSPFRSGLRSHIIQHYVWIKAAEQTLEAYQSVLKDTKNDN